MRYNFKVFPVIFGMAVIISGCGPARYGPSLIGPFPDGRPFEECSINPAFYKPVHERAGQDANIVLVVAASGGGYRAANFTAGALVGLEEIRKGGDLPGNALGEVDYFSSVSGGGFAVGAYISSYRDYVRFNGSAQGYSFGEAIAPTEAKCPCRHKPGDGEKYDPCIRKHLQGVYHEFIDDFFQTLLPWNHLGFNNRCQRFEQAIDDDTLGYRWRRMKLSPLYEPNRASQHKLDEAATLTLEDIFVRPDDVNRVVMLPYWFANAAVYQDGVIFPFSPEHLSLYKTIGYNHRGDEKKLPTGERSDEDIKNFAFKTPLSLAVTSSANFPLAMPPIRFTSIMDGNNPYFYLLDGGVADNPGAVTAIRLLSDEINEKSSRKVLIVIDSYQGALTPFEKVEKPPNEGDAAMRLMEIGMDSWRARYREIINEMCGQRGIKAIYVSFDDLVDADFNELSPFGLTAKDAKDLCEHKPRDCPAATPFHLVRSISMKAPVFWGKKGLEYRIPESQQNLLIAAGRYVVSKKQGEIRAAMGWD